MNDNHGDDKLLRSAALSGAVLGLCCIVLAALNEPGNILTVFELLAAVVVFTVSGTLFTLAGKRSKDR